MTDEEQGIPLDKYVYQELAHKLSSLSASTILSRGPGEQILVGRKNSSMYKCSLILSGPYLIMVGDLDTVVFAYSDSKTIDEAVRWIGSSGIGYVLPKAQVGMGHVGCENFEQEVALHEVLDHIKHEDEEEWKDKWTDVLQYLRDNTVHDQWEHQEFVEFMYKTLDDCELLSIGVCPSQRVLWGWAMCKHAVKLLDQEADLAKRRARLKFKRKIVERITNWEQHVGKGSWWQVPVTTLKLECGHEKVCRGSDVPKHEVICDECCYGSEQREAG